tara:strand:+ start:219 stop:464 length:246 start_codon:yes stop_codon:yes gene_type:complete
MDMILHFIVGLVITLVLLRLKVHLITIFLIVLSIAIGKEIHDTQYTINIAENIKDIFFTILPVYIMNIARIAKRDSKCYKG